MFVYYIFNHINNLYDLRKHVLNTQLRLYFKIYFSEENFEALEFV